MNNAGMSGSIVKDPVALESGVAATEISFHIQF